MTERKRPTVLDLVIRGGRLIDGTGGPARDADVGIQGGRVVEIGAVDDPARRVLDADGQVVAPGFIDVHTHYDAQVFWDGALTPTPLHGVTTVFAGNCGFSIAPLTPESAGYVAPMLAKVEGMSLDALREGVPWNWSTSREYLDMVDDLLAVNAGFSVGHSALRRAVMGPDSVTRTATDDEIEEMCELLRSGLASGAIGFSSSIGRPHQDADGLPVPSRHASEEEILRLASVCREFEGTSLQFAPMGGGAFSPEERDLMVRMSALAGRPVNWNVIRPAAENLDSTLEQLELADQASAAGGRVAALSMTFDFPARYSFLTGFALDGLPGWAEVLALPVGERLRALRDPATRQKLEEGARQTKHQQRLADWGNKRIEDVFSDVNAKYRGRKVADIAQEEGKCAFDVLIDIVCNDHLRTTFSRIPAVRTEEDWAACVRIWRDPRTVIGGSDAGAHVDASAGFHYPTYLLGEVVRERQLLGLEEAVRMLTAEPAELLGLKGRGVLCEGSWADIVIFDPEAVAPLEIEPRWDLPGGGMRLYGAADGIDEVLVAATTVVKGREVTGNCPGSVIRSGRDTDTPAVGR